MLVYLCFYVFTIITAKEHGVMNLSGREGHGSSWKEERKGKSDIIIYFELKLKYSKGKTFSTQQNTVSPSFPVDIQRKIPTGNISE